MLQDLRYTFRAFSKHPSFVAAGVLVLGIAVGVNTAVFSLLNSLLLRPLPVRAPNELGYVYASDPRVFGFNYSSYQDLRRMTDVFTGLAAKSSNTARLRADNDAIELPGEAVSANYFDLLGVVPQIGRSFVPSEDERQAATPIVVISDALWRSQFGSDPSIVGRTILLGRPPAGIGWHTGSQAYTIVGVAPPQFRGTGSAWQPAAYWVLLRQRALDYPPGRGGDVADWPVVGIGRLRPGVTFAQARAAVESAGRQILRRSTVRVPNASLQLVHTRRVTLPFAGVYFLDVPRIVVTLMAVAMMLLLMAGANLAGLLMARGVSRRAEIALRLTLGIGRVRLIRHLVIESVILAAGGSIGGLLVARVLLALTLHELPGQLAGSPATMLNVDVPLDMRVVAFAVGSCMATALAVGILPAAQALRTDLLASLNGSGIVAPRQSRSRLRRAVLVPQVALSLVLLLLTGAFVRSLLRIELASPGYDATHVVSVDLELPQHEIATSADVQSLTTATREIHARVLNRIEAMPEIEHAALTLRSPTGVPLATMTTTIIAKTDFGTTNRYRGVTLGIASADYFRTLQIPILNGRPFDARERRGDAQSVIVSDRFASEVWPGRNPVGEWLALHEPTSRVPPRWLEVVGVVGSVTLPLEEYPRQVLYVPAESMPLVASTIVVRGRGNPAQLIALVRQAVADTERSALAVHGAPLEELLGTVRYPRRFTAALLGASGGAGLLLATIGVFGLMMYAVAQRIGEIGVRLVLGAQRSDIIRLVLAEAASVVIAGIIAGFALSFAAIRYAAHAIVPLPDTDAVTFLVTPTVLIAAVLLACYLPARRAAQVDPMVVLRNG